MSSNTTTFSRLPGLTLTQRRAVQLMRQARSQADAESSKTIAQLRSQRAPSATTLREPVPDLTTPATPQLTRPCRPLPCGQLS